MSKESLRTRPLVPPPALARALGVPEGVVEKTIMELGIQPFRPREGARSFLTFEEVERIAKKIVPAPAAT